MLLGNFMITSLTKWNYSWLCVMILIGKGPMLRRNGLLFCCFIAWKRLPSGSSIDTSLPISIQIYPGFFFLWHSLSTKQSFDFKCWVLIKFHQHKWQYWHGLFSRVSFKMYLDKLSLISDISLKHSRMDFLPWNVFTSSSKIESKSSWLSAWSNPLAPEDKSLVHAPPNCSGHMSFSKW